jgi:hypothetical protein
MSDPTTTLDELMDRNPLELSNQDIDQIIAYQRKQRAALADSPTRGRAKKETGPGVKVDLAALGLLPKPAPVGVVKRRL